MVVVQRMWLLAQFFYALMHVQWIRFCRWLLKYKSLKPASRNFHKAVFIGDGLAMGIGDRVVLGASGGVASRLERLLQVGQARGKAAMAGGAYVASVAGGKQPRARWTVANRGEPESTSHDWLPGKPLFEATFGPGQPWHDAEVVVVMLGTQDVLQHMCGMAPEVLNATVPGLKARYRPDQFCDTVRNLQTVVEALLAARPSRRVLLLDVTEVRGYRLLTESNNAEVVYRVNRQIVDMIHRVGATAGAAAEGASAAIPGTTAAALTQQAATRKRTMWVHGSPMKIVARPWAHASDRVHLSPRGYKEFANWLKGPAVDAMLQVELDWWSKEMGFGGASPIKP